MRILVAICACFFAALSFGRPFPMQHAVSFAPKKMDAAKAREAEQNAERLFGQAAASGDNLEKNSGKQSGSGKGADSLEGAGAPVSGGSDSSEAGGLAGDKKSGKGLSVVENADGLRRGAIYFGILSEPKAGAPKLLFKAEIPEGFEEVNLFEFDGVKLALRSEVFSDRGEKFVKVGVFLRSLREVGKNFSESARVHIPEGKFVLEALDSVELGLLFRSSGAGQERLKCVLFRL